MAVPVSSKVENNEAMARRAGGQAALLFSGFAVAQGFSFVRNAMIGHWLSRGDFGIAASITLMLQLIEILSDVGVDRLIVQADDGEDRRLQANAHALLLLRGVVIAALILALAWPAAAFFHVPDAAPAFAAIALAPLLKGATHLDFRRLQRRLDNRPYMIIECAPQAVGLVVLVPVLCLEPSYWAVVWIASGQAVMSVVASHWLSERRYEVGLDTVVLHRMLVFGWPIWLSAVPLVAVYQGDRAIAGHLLGIEALAGYSAAFLITMVPGLVAAKVGNALMLPLLAASKHELPEFRRRCLLMCEITVLAAAAYACGFLIAGEAILPIAFGSQYSGLGLVTAWLAVMWALRMVQAVPGMALMARGQTRPFLVAGLVRTTALIAAVWAVHLGWGLAGVAAAGAAGELASAVYVMLRLEREVKGTGHGCMLRLGLLLPVLSGTALLCALTGLSTGFGPLLALFAAALLAASVAAVGSLAMPLLRAEIEARWTMRLAGRIASRGTA